MDTPMMPSASPLKDDLFERLAPLKQAGKIDEALALLEIALEKEPYNASFLNEKGILLSQIQRFMEATAYFEKAI
jgi:Flp pilus assembly protein TadD